jgi:DNA-binding winged helix-turn-helix (wHTH) protein
MVRPRATSTFTFGQFQIDCEASELRKRGRKLRIPQQPVQMLAILVAAAGDIVTREQLRDAVWTPDTHVDFDRGINKGITRLRQVLGDVPHRPRFIETVPRRGYRFLAAVTRSATPVRAISVEAREALLKARHFSGKRTVQDIARTVDYFRQAIERDPDYAEAWAGLAEAHAVTGIFGLRARDEAFPAAKVAAERALALNGALAQAHTVIADVRKFYDWDWRGAEHAYRRAIELDPHAALSHHWYSQLLAMLARHAEAFAEIETARRCDPASPVVNAFISYIHLEARQYHEAIVAAEKALELDSAAPLPYYLLGRASAKVGDSPRAIEALTDALRLGGSVPLFEANLGYAYARGGRRVEAETILERLSRGQISPVERALVALGLRHTEEALSGLEEAYAAHLPGTLIAGDPFFSELASERRYRELMGRLHLPVQASGGCK